MICFFFMIEIIPCYSNKHPIYINYVVSAVYRKRLFFTNIVKVVSESMFVELLSSIFLFRSEESSLISSYEI